MPPNKITARKISDAAELRRRAEERLKERQRSQRSEEGMQRKAEDTRVLVQELQIHQIELEMQNKEMRESRAKVDAGLALYTELYDFAPVGYFTLERDGAIHQVNLAGAKLLGVERGALIKRRFGIFVSAQSRTTFNAFIEKVFRSRQKETCEVAFLKDGADPVWAHIEAITEDGQECRAVMSDITERKRAEGQLKESEEQFRSIFENSVDTILLTAPDGSIFAANPAACSMFGRSEEELRQIGLAGIVDLSDPQWIGALEERKQTGLYRKEYSHIRKDGTRFPTEVSSNIFLDKDGHERTIVIIRDITSRKQAEEELTETAEKLRKSLAGTLQAMSRTVEIRDPHTAGHERRVSTLVRSIAQEMGLSQAVTNTIHMASSIHDIGKISIPSEILSKPSRLSEMEMSLIKIHPQAGYDILKDSELPYPVAEIILQHHERLDGSGYPQGLKGDQILLEAQIIAVADVVEAMASHRPYRPALGIDAALEEIEKNKGILYNAAVVRACLHVFREKGFKFE